MVNNEFMFKVTLWRSGVAKDTECVLTAEDHNRLFGYRGGGMLIDGHVIGSSAAVWWVVCGFMHELFVGVDVSCGVRWVRR